MRCAQRLPGPPGTVLVVAILLLSLLTTLGIALLGASLNENVVSSNDVNSQRALAVAEAGIAHARKLIASNLSTTSLTTRLSTATSASPYVAVSGISDDSEALGTGNGKYTVRISNNLTAYNKSPGYPAESAAATDADSKVWIRSVGTYKNATRTVRALVDFCAACLMDPPGAITLVDGALPVVAQTPGPPIAQSTDFDGTTFLVTGTDTAAPTTDGTCGTASGTKYGVSTNSAASQTALSTALDNNQEVRVQGTGNTTGTSTTGSYANNGNISTGTLAATVSALIPYATTIPGGSNSNNYGTGANPGIYLASSNVNLNGNGKGFGILIVTADFEMSGNYKWEGIVLVVGTGSVAITGADSKIFGAILAVDTQGGSTSLNISGNGGAYFSSQAICRIKDKLATSTIIAWEQQG